MFCLRNTSFLFVWQGINTLGQRISGSEQAPNKKTVAINLQQQQIIPLTIHRRLSFCIIRKKFKSQQRIYFTQQLAQLILVGLSISQALTIIAHSLPQQSTWLATIKQQVDNGATLSYALSQYPQDFNTLYCALVRSGEQTGKLGEILLELVNHLEMMQHFQQKIRKALYYPAIVIVLALLITTGLMLFVIPQFEQTFASFGVALPFLTRSIIGTADFFRHHFFQLALIFGALLFLFTFLSKNNLSFQYRLHALLLRLPIVNHLLITTFLALWMKILSTALSAGLSLVEALCLANHSLSNQALQKILAPLTQAIQSGIPLYIAMQQCKIFPKITFQLILVGENTGQLPALAQKLATIQQKQMINLLDTVTQLLEPVIMLILALFATLLIVAIYLPIFKLGSLL